MHGDQPEGVLANHRSYMRPPSHASHPISHVSSAADERCNSSDASASDAAGESSSSGQNMSGIAKLKIEKMRYCSCSVRFPRTFWSLASRRCRNAYSVRFSPSGQSRIVSASATMQSTRICRRIEPSWPDMASPSLTQMRARVKSGQDSFGSAHAPFGPVRHVDDARRRGRLRHDRRRWRHQAAEESQAKTVGLAFRR